jgi:hypothetical protein
MHFFFWNNYFQFYALTPREHKTWSKVQIIAGRLKKILEHTLLELLDKVKIWNFWKYFQKSVSKYQSKWETNDNENNK